MHILLIGAGGALGAIGRYGVGVYFMAATAHTGFPYATFSVNIIGSLLIGILAGAMLFFDMHKTGLLWSFLAIGILGGFTTFSSFSLDLLFLLEKGHYISAIYFAGGSLICGLGAVIAGFYGIKAILS